MDAAMTSLVDPTEGLPPIEDDGTPSDTGMSDAPSAPMTEETVEGAIAEDYPVMYDLSKKAETMFNAHGLVLTPQNAENMLETHIAATARCLMYLMKDDEEGRTRACIRGLNELHGVYFGNEMASKRAKTE
jgi:hypothetical protein